MLQGYESLLSKENKTRDEEILFRKIKNERLLMEIKYKEQELSNNLESSHNDKERVEMWEKVDEDFEQERIKNIQLSLKKEDEKDYKEGSEKEKLKNLKLEYFLKQKFSEDNEYYENIKSIVQGKEEEKVDFSKRYTLLENISFSLKTIELFFKNKNKQDSLKDVDSIKFVNCTFPEYGSAREFFQKLNQQYNITRLKFKKMNISILFQDEETFSPYHYREITFQECRGFKEVNPLLFSSLIYKSKNLKFLTMMECELNSDYIKGVFDDLIKYNCLPKLKELNLSGNPFYKVFEDFKKLNGVYIFAMRLGSLNIFNFQNTDIPIEFLQEWENDINNFHPIQILGGNAKISNKGKEGEFNEGENYPDGRKDTCCSGILCCKCSFNFSFFDRKRPKEEIEIFEVSNIR